MAMCLKAEECKSRWLKRTYALLASGVVNTQEFNVMYGPEFVEQNTWAFADCSGTFHEMQDLPNPSVLRAGSMLPTRGRF